MLTREQTLDWIKNLKVGDKVRLGRDYGHSMFGFGFTSDTIKRLEGNFSLAVVSSVNKNWDTPTKYLLTVKYNDKEEIVWAGRFEPAGHKITLNTRKLY